MPIARFQMPDGRIARFEVPDGTTPEQAQAQYEQWHASQGTNSVPQASNPAQPGVQREPAKRQPRGLTEQFMRGLGITARGAAKGVTGLAGIVGDPLNTIVNMALPKDRQLAMPSQVLQRGINAVTPDPETGAEHAVEMGATFAGGLLDPASKFMVDRLAPPKPQARKPTVREQTIMQARKEGYVMPPSLGRNTRMGRVLEFVAGGPQTAVAAAERNQGVTDRLARKAAGLGQKDDLSRDTIENAIHNTYRQGYQPIEDISSRFTNGRVFRHSLDNILNEYQGAARSFPGAAPDDVQRLTDTFRVRDYQPKDAISAIKQLRKNSKAAYSGGNPAYGAAQREVADALEESVELNLAGSGPDMLRQFRNAREQLAKQYVVQDAVREGTGNTEALKIAAALNRKKPLTDELRTIGEFGNVAGRVAHVPQDMTANMSPWSGMLPPMMGGALAGIMGEPVAASTFVALPFARHFARKGLLTNAGQRAFVDPKLEPTLLDKALADPRVLRMLPAAQTGIFGE